MWPLAKNSSLAVWNSWSTSCFFCGYFQYCCKDFQNSIFQLMLFLLPGSVLILKLFYCISSHPSPLLATPSQLIFFVTDSYLRIVLLIHLIRRGWVVFLFVGVFFQSSLFSSWYIYSNLSNHIFPVSNQYLEAVYSFQSENYSG